MIRDKDMKIENIFPAKGCPVKAHFIFNPVAGGGKARKIYPDLVSHCNAHFGENFSISITKDKGDATAFATEISKNGTPLIISVGGDGTINEVVNGLYKSGKLINPELELGIIDCGSGRGFSQSIGLPDGFSKQFNMILNAQGKLIDLGKCTHTNGNGTKADRLFVSECQIGIGSAVVSEVQDKHKTWGGKVAFGYVALKEVLRSRRYNLNVLYNNTNIKENMVGVVVGNGHSCGGGMKLTPSAKVNDGILDLLVIHDMNIPELIRQFTKIYSGSHIKSGRFTYEQTDNVRIESDLDVMVETDGELLGTLPVEIKVVQKCLKVKCNI